MKFYIAIYMQNQNYSNTLFLSSVNWNLFILRLQNDHLVLNYTLKTWGHENIFCFQIAMRNNILFIEE